MTRSGGTAALGIVVVALGCSTSSAPARDGGTQSNADAFVQAMVCSTPWLLVGQAATELPVTVHDGDSTGTDMFTVACTVHAVGAGFDVSLSLVDQGPQGGSVTIESPAGAGAVTASGGSGITATFTSALEGTARGSDCTITPTYQGQPVSQNPSIFAGKIWGHVSCPTAVRVPEGGVPDAAGTPCDAEADFLFEGCSQ